MTLGDLPEHVPLRDVADSRVEQLLGSAVERSGVIGEVAPCCEGGRDQQAVGDPCDSLAPGKGELLGGGTRGGGVVVGEQAGDRLVAVDGGDALVVMARRAGASASACSNRASL